MLHGEGDAACATRSSVDQAICLFYPSTSRDEDVFPDPFVFRIDRDPNPHIGFGMAEHLCVGAHLARLELRHAFAQLRDRLEHCEPDGAIARVRSSFFGGIKHAPMRWQLRPRRDGSQAS